MTEPRSGAIGPTGSFPRDNAVPIRADPRAIDTLITGATGYVGGRLVSALVQEGIYSRCLARHPEHLRQRVPAGTDVVAGDLLEPGSLVDAFRGVRVAYYLVHSMGAGHGYERRDKQAAENFARHALEAGV